MSKKDNIFKRFKAAFTAFWLVLKGGRYIIFTSNPNENRIDYMPLYYNYTYNYTVSE